MRFVQRRRRQPVVPIISLIDILAILLIFFILTSTFRERKTFANITLPKAGALAARESFDSRLELAITADSRVLLGGEEVSVNSLAQALTRLRAERPEVKLELKADEDAPLKILVRAWDALTRAGFRVKDVPARILIEKPGSSTSP